jgi:cardiolipin synthase
MAGAGAVLLAFAVLCIIVPLLLAIPLALAAVWTGIALLLRAYQLHRAGRPPD